MQRLIITGANGVGKSHLTAQLRSVRPEVPVISFDAIKLETDWRQRSRSEIQAALAVELMKDAWILEGGPSLLSQAIEKADALIWIDPPEYVRAWRLASRPWKFIGETRPEIPEGNVDWPWQQYKFALRSLRNRSKFRADISEMFVKADNVTKWHCRTDHSLRLAIDQWAEGGV